MIVLQIQKLLIPAFSSNYKYYLDLVEKGQKGPTAKQLRMMAAMKRIMGE